MRHSLRVRLFFTFMVLTVLIVSIVGVVASRATSAEFKRYVTACGVGGMMTGRRFEMALTRYYNANGSWEGVQELVLQVADLTGQRVVLSDASGHVVGDSEGTLLGRDIEHGWGSAVEISSFTGPAGYLYFNPATAGAELGADFLRAVNRSLALAVVVAAVVAFMLTALLSRRILAPVEQLTAAAQRMEQGDLSQRVYVPPGDEIGQLARAFNAMADGLARDEQLRRNMVGDVAHELRTPLANIRGYLEGMRDGVIVPTRELAGSLHDEALLLSRLVDDLQDLALAEAGQLQLECAPAEPATLVQQAVAAFAPQAKAQQVELRADLPRELPLVEVDAYRIGQVLRNLIKNAFTHTPIGGQVVVSARVQGQGVAFSVRDTGSGIAPEHLPHVWERFYRADPSRARATGGAGLGLTIVKQLVEAHGGYVSASSTPGQGSTFTFTLPVSNT